MDNMVGYHKALRDIMMYTPHTESSLKKKKRKQVAEQLKFLKLISTILSTSHVKHFFSFSESNQPLPVRHDTR